MSILIQSPEDLNRMKLSELKKLCKDYGISATGGKSELVARLLVRQDAPVDLDIQLQPEDEAVLLGDIDETAVSLSKTINLPAAAAVSVSAAVPVAKASTVEKPFLATPIVLGNGATSGLKRSADAMDESDGMSSPEAKKTRQTTNKTPLTASKTVPSDAAENDGVTTPSTSPIETPRIVGQSVFRLQEKERLAARAERFAGSLGGGVTSSPGGGGLGAVHADKRMAERARRFGLPVVNTSSTSPASKTAASGTKAGARGGGVVAVPVDVAKLKQRADRFGVTTSSLLDKAVDCEKLAKRAEKFGLVLPPAGAEAGGTSDSDTCIATGAGVESMADAEKRKAARAARFAAVKKPADAVVANGNTAAANAEAAATAAAAEEDARRQMAERLARFGATPVTAKV